MAKIIVSIIIGAICALLGAWGGAENTTKGWRRVGIPLTIASFALCVLRRLWLLTTGSLGFVLSLGYGVPNPYVSKPSKIGKFWYNVFNKNEKLAMIFTRLTIGLLKGMCILSIPIIKGCWIPYIIAVLLICAVNILFGGDALIRNEGTITLFGKKLLWEEIIIHGIVGSIISYLILL